MAMSTTTPSAESASTPSLEPTAPRRGPLSSPDGGPPRSLGTDLRHEPKEHVVSLSPLAPGAPLDGGGDAIRRVEAALIELREGRLVLVVDDEDRENEGDLVMAAQFVTAAQMAFLIRHTSGIVCVAMDQGRASELQLPPMVVDGDDPRGTAFTVSIDLKAGTSTGVSASDRALSARALAATATSPADLARPGHVFPLIARPGGVLERGGHTEATVDLCRLAGVNEVGVLAEVTNDDGSMARRPDLTRFAAEHGLRTLSVADIATYRRHRETRVERQASGRVPTPHGEFTMITYRGTSGTEHVALVLGAIEQHRASDPPVLVRVHSECLTGDVFGSRRCDCGEQLDASTAAIAEAGRGVVIYLRGHEGRGIGLSHKLQAYNLQDAGLDTVDANLVQGLPIDSRDYSAAAEILHDLGVRHIVLLTNNPAKTTALAFEGIEVADQRPVIVPANPENLRYLATKRSRLAHTLDVTAAG